MDKGQAKGIIQWMFRIHGIKEFDFITLTDYDLNLLCGTHLVLNNKMEWTNDIKLIRQQADSYYKHLQDGCDTCSLVNNCPLCIYNE